MGTIPVTQFAMFEVIRQGYKDKICSYNKYQTFEEAFNELSNLVDGATLIEIPSDNPFEIEYVVPKFSVSPWSNKLRCETNHYIIKTSLFTYNDEKPLVTDNYWWTQKEKQKESKVI